MKLTLLSKIPDKYLPLAFASILRDIQDQVNGISSGTQAFVNNAYTAAPTTGTYAKGDFVLNSNPSEAGSAGSKYIIHGWRCTVSGTPGTWLECRFLTGN